MRRILMPIIGGTGPDDPRRIDLPTYQMLEESPDGRTVVVLVPDEDLPADTAFDPVPGLNGKPVVLDPAQLPIRALDAWHARLDERYKEHAGEFRPSPLRGP